ncbi:hypothetical protein [Falsiroseomonas sp.]|uniref:hypothetical protein n=1 Tax=Falsiroseomonas sp. TaxID=2870721 RepID=UPI0035624DA7
MSGTTKRNRLMPWYIGLVLILATLAFAGWELASGGCGAPPAALVIALLVMPAVYIGLMYMTLTSQE